MQFGQIIHDIVGLDGYLTSTKEDLSGIINSSNNSYETSKINITQNLVTKIGSNNFDSIGIQAPPGTIAVINGHNFQIGLNGVYELHDKDILITSLSFLSNDIKNLIIDYIIAI